jgi:hypothetical protein
VQRQKQIKAMSGIDPIENGLALGRDFRHFLRVDGIQFRFRS